MHFFCSYDFPTFPDVVLEAMSPKATSAGKYLGATSLLQSSNIELFSIECSDVMILWQKRITKVYEIVCPERGQEACSLWKCLDRN